jgi:hypothetical protein
MQNKTNPFTLALGLSDDLSEARDATEELRDIPLPPTFSDALEAELPGRADQAFVGSVVEPALPDKTEGSFSEILHDLLFFTSSEYHLVLDISLVIKKSIEMFDNSIYI